MSSNRSTSLTYSLEEFSRNGSRIRSNRDGWGIALARDRDVMLVKEPRPASDNIWVRFIAENAIETDVAIAHVRYATRGEHTMQNTHPFHRVLGKRVHVFAHNGTLAGIHAEIDETELAFRPIGETDSELAFCVLLTRLAPLYKAEDLPSAESRTETFRSFCADMKNFGPSNILYYDGDVLFGHGDRRIYEEQDHLTEPRPPGLQIKKCWACAGQREIHGKGLDLELGDQQTVLIASVPLDANGWEPLEEGTVVALKSGAIVYQG